MKKEKLPKYSKFSVQFPGLVLILPKLQFISIICQPICDANSRFVCNFESKTTSDKHGRLRHPSVLREEENNIFSENFHRGRAEAKQAEVPFFFFSFLLPDVTMDTLPGLRFKAARKTAM